MLKKIEFKLKRKQWFSANGRCLCPLDTHLFHVGYYVLMVGYSGEHEGSGWHTQICRWSNSGLSLGCYNGESVVFPVNTLFSKFPYLSPLWSINDKPAHY